MPPSFVNLPQDIYHHIVSDDDLGIQDIISLKQTCRALRTRIVLLLTEHPAIYREKLASLAKIIPTGLPKDLSAFTIEQLEIAALSAYAVEKRWRCDSPTVSRPPRFFTVAADTDGNHTVVVLKVLPGGRWIIVALEDGDILVWDTVEDKLVAQHRTGSGLHWIELEIAAKGEVMMVITGYRLEDVLSNSRPFLSVYSLKIDPLPTSHTDVLLTRKGHVISPMVLTDPAIKGSLACATYMDDEALGILVYDWQMDAATILTMDYTTLHHEINVTDASLVILPHTILLFLRSRNRPIVWALRIPELHEMNQGDENVSSPRLPPPSIAAVPEAVENIEHHTDPVSGDPGAFLLKWNIVEHPSSSSSSLSLTSLLVATDGLPHIICDLTSIKCSSEPFTMTHREQLRRTVRIPTCAYGPDAWIIASDDAWPWPELAVVLGHTGRRAIWAETSVWEDSGALIGFTAPALLDSDDWESVDHSIDNSTNITGIGHYEFEERQRQRPEFFRGTSVLRRLPIFPILAPEGPNYMFKDITALGFDESTATVALSDQKGRVWVLNYGPRNAVGIW